MSCSRTTHARSTARAVSTWLVAAAAFASVAGCGDAAGPPGEVSSLPSPAEPEVTGSMSFELTVPHGVKFEAFSYVITGPNFARSGGVDVSNSTIVSVLVEGIPAGSGYTVTLQGTTTAPATATCSGSATFGVLAGRVTDVPVAIACHVADAVAPPTPAPVPIPPLAPVATAVALLAIGARATRRRWRSVG